MGGSRSWVFQGANFWIGFRVAVQVHMQLNYARHIGYDC